jgi:hypothetical protein
MIDLYTGRYPMWRCSWGICGDQLCIVVHLVATGASVTV